MEDSNSEDISSLEKEWSNILANRRVKDEMELPTAFGRTLLMTRHADQMAFFTFSELCQKHVDGIALGAPDFVALSENYSTIFLSEMTQLRRREEARRLVVLIDTLYDHQVRLFCGSECKPSEIFQVVMKHEDCKLEEKLAYARATSRLKQMTS